MQVFEISVTRMRKAQPKEYETAAAEVTLKAQLEDGDDHRQVLTTLLDDARDAVYTNLGMKLPARAASAEPASKPAETKPASKSAETKPAETKPAETKAAEKPDDDDDGIPDDDGGKKRTRRNKNQMEVARNAAKYGLSQEDADNISAKEAERLVNAGDDDDIPDDDGGKGNISTSPEDRKNPDDDDIPDDGDPAPSGKTEEEELAELTGESGITTESVTMLVRELVTGKKIGPSKVKELMAETGSKKSRIQDLEPENLEKLNDALVKIREG